MDMENITIQPAADAMNIDEITTQLIAHNQDVVIHGRTLQLVDNSINGGVPIRMRLTHIRRLARTINATVDTSNASGQNYASTSAVTDCTTHNQGANIQNRTLQCIESTSSNSGVPIRMRLTRIRQLARTINVTGDTSTIAVGQNQASASVTHNHTTHNQVVGNTTNHRNGQPNDLTIRPTRAVRAHHNSARNFRENMGVPPLYLKSPTTCPYCNARLFHHETSTMCCARGSIELEQIPSPPELLHLYSAQTTEGRHFRQNIRSYNHVFAFTSMGVQVDQSSANCQQGIYTFRAQGSIYHRIGSLLPANNSRPRYLQIYIYDTNQETDYRLQENGSLHRNIVEQIQQILNVHNPFVHKFRQLAQDPHVRGCRLIIKEQPSNRRQYTLPSESQVAAIIKSGEDIPNLERRDIIVQTHTGSLLHIHDCAGYYDPMQYPLLFPYGTYGWDENSHSDNGGSLTCLNYYAYRLQTIIRAELYQGLHDSLNGGENNAANIGRRTVLPSTFIGSPRDMYQRYHDAMALVQKYGKPDLFITMTCNPGWEEIQNELLPGQTPPDRPDLVTRIFHSKFQELKTHIIDKGVLGRVIAHAHVIEYQKRGLPHVHILIILEENDKIVTPDDYDEIVLAEIPNKDEQPQLYNAVLKHMIHGPCGVHKPNASCMKNGKCKRSFPKSFAHVTMQGNDSYPIYRRRDFPPILLEQHGNIMVDNSWVVPYNPWLLLKYNCHINVEICSSIKSVKYLYKYIHKGPDRVTLEVRPESVDDEIKTFVDARWVCAHEALWRIFQFRMGHIYPSVMRLQIHLPNMQQVRFYSHEMISNVLAEERNLRTTLTEFFATNSNEMRARQYLYSEFPEHYRWNDDVHRWSRRRSNKRVVGRIYTVSPREGEKFYLRMLLNHIRGPTSFSDLLTINGTPYPTFKKAAEKRGLLEDDDSIRQCLLEASAIRMPKALRRLFVTLLVYCEPIGVRCLWDEFYAYMVEDYPSTSTPRSNMIMNRLLRDLSVLLSQHNKRISEYDLPMITSQIHDFSGIQTLIQDELTISIPQEDYDAIENLNSEQKYAFDTIISAITDRKSAIFFVDGPGGTGKTYLYRALLSSLRSDGYIVLATATSGISATLLPGGRTAHSRFKIPINPHATSTCSISKQSDLAELIRRASAVIWDEAPMAHRYVFEALDRTFRDLIDVDLPFGGKVMIFGGDFRQVLPVVRNGTKAEMIQASVVKSSFWRHTKVLSLKENMRSKSDPEFSEFLLRIGNGQEPTVIEDKIQLPSSIVLHWEGEETIDKFINEVFPNLCENINNRDYIVERAIISPLNEDVDVLNDRIIRMFPGEEEIVYSFDWVEDDPRNLYQQELLNSTSPGGFPPHKLTLKNGVPIMLLRNIDPKVGLCNGTRLLCRGCYNNVIDAEILSGQFVGTRVFLPRIPLKTAENSGLPFEMTRKQFPVKLSFALTINKSQGQTIPNVGIYLPDHVFGHGQLYVALSRGVSKISTRVLVKKGLIDNQNGVFTRNIVYHEVLLPQN